VGNYSTPPSKILKPQRQLTAFALTVACLLLPEAAWAWGPGTHLKYAEIVINNLHLLPASLADMIARHPACYLYGNLIADLILGKKYNIEAHEHSHNWQNILRLKAKAPDDTVRTIIWGYLTHLAADVVAHNVFIPVQMIRSAPGRGRGHAYWEMHYDGHVPDRYVQSATQVATIARPHGDAFLMRELASTIFSHRTNRLIFSGTLAVQRLQLYRRLAYRSIRRSPFRLEPRAVRYYDQLSLNAIYNLFRQGESGAVVGFDPNGHDAIAAATTRRNHMRKRHSRPPAIERLHAEYATPLRILPPHNFQLSAPTRRIGSGSLIGPGRDIGEQTPSY